jgi:hypothetical protein
MKGIIWLSALANKDRGEKCPEEALGSSELTAPTGSRQRRKQFWKCAQKETKKRDAVGWRSSDARKWRSFLARCQKRGKVIKQLRKPFLH